MKSVFTGSRLSRAPRRRHRHHRIVIVVVIVIVVMVTLFVCLVDRSMVHSFFHRFVASYNRISIIFGLVIGRMDVVYLETSVGTIAVELYSQHAPRTCNNFRELAKMGKHAQLSPLIEVNLTIEASNILCRILRWDHFSSSYFKFRKLSEFILVQSITDNRISIDDSRWRPDWYW